MTKQPNWWETFFDDFRPIFARFSRADTNAEARFIARKLGLKRGSRFLDFPCGYGRISLPLAKMGVKVTGVDITQSYLDEFARNAKKAGVRVDLLRADMRRISYRNQFDAATNWSTSIGYFGSDAQDLLVFKRVFAALKPGGRFLLGAINRDWIIKEFTPSNVDEIGGVTLLQTRWFDYSRSVMHDKWRIQKDGVEKVHETVLRLYSFHELKSMFERAGFIDVEGLGSFTDEPTGRRNRHMYVLGRKP